VALLVYPYPYWFGFPGAYYGFYYGFYPYAGYWWYPYYPHHHFGFYYGPRHRTVVYGFPSHYFLRWYFGSGSHHEHYPHLSRRLTRHRGAHRTSHDRVSHHVERWQRASRPREQRLRGGGPRVARLRESGRPTRATWERARERPESRHGWSWLLEDRRRVREAEPSARRESRSSGRRAREDRDRSGSGTREAEPSVRRESRSSGRRVRDDRARDRSSRRTRAAEPSARERPRAQERKRPSANKQKPRRDARDRLGQPTRRHSAKPNAGRAPRANGKHGIGSREKSRRQVSRPSGGRSARAMAPRLEAPSHQRAARGLKRQNPIGHGRPGLAKRGGARPRAKGPGSRDR
jgi:hypothetical protein